MQQLTADVFALFRMPVRARACAQARASALLPILILNGRSHRKGKVIFGLLTFLQTNQQNKCARAQTCFYIFRHHSHTNEPIFIKFCTDILLHQGEVLGKCAMLDCACARAHDRERMFSHTTELIFMKFFTDILLHQGEVLGGCAMLDCARARAHDRKHILFSGITATLLNRFS